MKMTIKIDTSNAAFSDGNDGAEVARILRELADKVDGGSPLARSNSFMLRDINGNCVGEFKTSAR